MFLGDFKHLDEVLAVLVRINRLSSNFKVLVLFSHQISMCIVQILIRYWRHYHLKHVLQKQRGQIDAQLLLADTPVLTFSATNHITYSATLFRGS